MQIVIEISEAYYDAIKEIPVRYCTTDMLLIKTGTPLPKGHGDLIDLEELTHEFWDGNYMEIHKDDLSKIKAIIPAERSDTE